MPDTKLATVNFGPAKDCIEVVLFIILSLSNVDAVLSLSDQTRLFHVTHYIIRLC